MNNHSSYKQIYSLSLYFFLTFLSVLSRTGAAESYGSWAVIIGGPFAIISALIHAAYIQKATNAIAGGIVSLQIILMHIHKNIVNVVAID